MENNINNNIMEIINAIQSLVEKANKYDALEQAYESAIAEFEQLKEKYEELVVDSDDYDAFKDLVADYGEISDIREKLDDYYDNSEDFENYKEISEDFESFKELMDEYGSVDDIKEMLEDYANYEEMKERVSDFVSDMNYYV